MQKQDYVSIWLCNFKSEIDFQKYIEEDYSNEDKIESQFIKSFNLGYIDNQFFEAEYCSSNEKLKNTVLELSYSEYFVSQLIIESQYNSIIAVYNYSYQGSVNTDANSKYLGTYKYED
jgi:hypothetical protein